MAEYRYDCIVIGTGQGGTPLAMALAAAGRKTAVIERVAVGGSCINWGCTPTKTLAASARMAYLARRSRDYGIETGPVSVDMPAVKARKQAVVDTFRSGVEQRLMKTNGLDFLRGQGRFTATRVVEVHLNTGETLRLTGELIFINTGVRAAIPPIDGIADVSAMTSKSIMELDTVPEKLIVLGGSYVGLEFGQMFRRFGSDVEIVEIHQQLVPREDEDVAAEVAKILQEDGIRIRTQARTTRVLKADGGVRVEVSTPQGEEALTGSHMLVAVGIRPNTEDLNLAATGVETDEKGYIKVNDRLETSAAGIYALGDVKGGPAFTHISYDDYRILRLNILDGGNATIANRLVPYVVFTDPQLGRVGLTEKEARARGHLIRVANLPMTNVARAHETAETRGLMKAVVDAETNQILGCAVLGTEGGELMAMMEIAIMGKLPYTELQNGIFAHPTWAESLNNLFMNIK